VHNDRDQLISLSSLRERGMALAMPRLFLFTGFREEVLVARVPVNLPPRGFGLVRVCDSC